jgi:hypothetical protein
MYRRVMKAAYRLQDYNFRSYFIRRAREEARRNTWSTEKWAEHLGMLERQSVIQQLYRPKESLMFHVAKELTN